MDDSRRRPPMEGFTPGRGGLGRGGEFSNDESVEGHIMGNRLGATSDDDDTEGHGNRLGVTSDDDDTEGHGSRVLNLDDDDTEGHGNRLG
jgi:hypothetical protein